MDGNNPVCYHMGNASDFENPNPKYQWIALTNDMSIGKVTDEFDAGMISLKLSIHNKTTDGEIDFTKYDAWKKPPPKRLNSIKVRCHIYQCRDLPAADDTGASDPYIEIWSPEKEKILTTVIENNVNPVIYRI